MIKTEINGIPEFNKQLLRLLNLRNKNITVLLPRKAGKLTLNKIYSELNHGRK